MLENKLGIKAEAELALAEERISKIKAYYLFEKGILDILEVGTFSALSKIHRYLFEDIYNFAGEVRTENIAKGNFRFASLMYLEVSLKK
jgi:cell filamentation protein